MTEILLIWLSWRRFFLSGIKEMKILLERSFDRALVNGQWLQAFPQSSGRFKEVEILDHA